MTDTPPEVEPSVPGPPARSGLSRIPVWVRIAVPLVVVIGIIAAILIGTLPHSFTAQGRITIAGVYGTVYKPDPGHPKLCRGAGDATRLAAGERVTVTDPKGRTLSVAHLGSGRFESDRSVCIITFTMTGVTPGEPYYWVDYAGIGRAKYSQKEMHTLVEMYVDE